jgi:hypothetical protein
MMMVDNFYSLNFFFTFFFRLDPGYIEFEEPINLVKESVGKVELKVARVHGADGRVTVRYKTKDIDAKAVQDYEGESEINFRGFVWCLKMILFPYHVYFVSVVLS